MFRALLPLMLVACPAPEPDSVSPSTAGTIDSAPQVSWLDLSEDVQSIKGNHAPGMVAAVAASDALVALGVAGRRQRGQDAVVEPSDRFHIGSITKVYTALLVARLVDAGEVSWDLTLGEVFPDSHPDWSEVTLQMLLLHEGGATASIGGDFPALWSQMFADGDSDILATRAEFAATVLAQPPAQAPGTTVYSNAGLMLVGAVLEAKRGLSWEEDLSTWVLEPLQQTDCVFGPPLGEQPWGHDALTGEPVDPVEPLSDNPPAMGPAGTLSCSVASLAGLGQAYMQAADGDTSFISAASYAVLTEASSAGFVPGMIRDENQPWANGSVFVMTGSNSYWLSTIWIAPGLDRTFAVISNRASADAEAVHNDAVLFMIEEGF